MGKGIRKNSRLQRMREDEIAILSSLIFNFIKDEPLLSGDCLQYIYTFDMYTSMYLYIHRIYILLSHIIRYIRCRLCCVCMCICINVDGILNKH